MRLLIALLFTFVWPLHAASPKRLIIIGDSITEGFGVSHEQAFPALLQKKIDKLDKNWLVVGSGISGSTTASAPSRVQWHVKQKPALIILALGANDGLRGTKTKVIEENLTKALDICRKAGIKVVLAGMKMPPNYGSEYTKEFEAVFLRVASKTGVPFIPFLLDKVAGDPKLNQEDGIHPNEKGHAIIAETVFKAIHKLL
jgi:acyl-CoA thioesterase-1